MLQLCGEPFHPQAPVGLWTPSSSHSASFTQEMTPSGIMVFRYRIPRANDPTVVKNASQVVMLWAGGGASSPHLMKSIYGTTGGESGLIQSARFSLSAGKQGFTCESLLFDLSSMGPGGRSPAGGERDGWQFSH